MTLKNIRPTEHKDFGKSFVFDKEYDELKAEYRHTYCQLQELYDEKKITLDYNPKNYTFDKETTEYLDDYPGYLGGIYEKGNKHYNEFQVIRENIAMVRLGMYQQLFPEGYKFKDDTEKAHKLEIIKEMGECLGATLKHESRIRFFTNLFNFSKQPLAEKRFGKFGIEHMGAAEMYKRVLKKQNRVTLNPIRWLQGKARCYDWNLPPIDQTVFCHHDIEEAIFTDSHKKDIGVQAPAKHLAAEAKNIFETCFNLSSQRLNVHRRPEALNDNDAEQSIILAHRILDNWKHIQASSDKRSIDEIDIKHRDLEKSELMAEIAITYDKIMADMSAHSPEFLQQDINNVFSNAKIAMGKLGYLTLLHAIDAADKQGDGNLKHELLQIEEHKVPDAYKQVTPREERALMEQIEQALKAAEQYRAQKMARSASQQVAATLTPEQLSARHTKEIAGMHNKISNTQISAANSWAIPEAKRVNEEIKIAQEQKAIQNTTTAPLGVRQTI
jgi:hypothetical protein